MLDQAFSTTLIYHRAMIRAHTDDVRNSSALYYHNHKACQPKQSITDSFEFPSINKHV